MQSVLSVICLGLAAAAAEGPKEEGVCGESTFDTAQTVSLLQITRFVRGDGSEKQLHQPAADGDNMTLEAAEESALPELSPLEHWFLSSDVNASAEFWVRYYGGKVVTVRGVPADTLALGVELTNTTLVFVQSEETSKFPAFVDSARGEIDKVMAKQQLYSPWMDNHDGYSVDEFDFENAAADNLLLQAYPVESNFSNSLPHLYRIYMPGTVWTIEMTKTSEAEEMMTQSHIMNYIDAMTTEESPDACRVRQSDPGTALAPAFGWWKSTFASPDPKASAAFAVFALGAELYESPFPWPPRDGCISAIWVMFPGQRQFMMHFVYSELAYPPGEQSMSSLAEFVDQEVRDVGSGQFDEYMYNNIALWADSLDPYVERLQKRGVPFLPARLGEDLFALFVSFPLTSITVQIKSSQLTLVEPKGLEQLRSSA